MKQQQQQLSPKDWQLLSEYLDGQLSSRDKANLEKRLNSQANLRAAYEELRLTRVTLRSVPMQRAPRNFTLTPAMVQQYRPRPTLRLIPMLNFASAVAAIAVVITVAIQLLPGLSSASTGRQAAPASAPAPMLSQTVENQNDNSAPPVIVQWGNTSNGTALGMGGGFGGGDSSSILSAPATGLGGGAAEPGFVIPPSAAPEQPSQKAPPPEGTPNAALAPAQAMPTQSFDAAANAAEAPSPTGTPQPELQTQPTQEVAMAPLEGSGPILGARPPQEAETENQSRLAEQALKADQASPDQIQKLLWIVPALLALIAVGAGLASWIIKRKAGA